MISLKFQYTPLFVIKLNHNYYEGQPAENFQLIPTKRTVQLIDRMGMLLRHKEGELHILCDTSRKEMLLQRLKQASAAELKFSFFLFTSNPCFANITDIPMDRKGKVFYCSNRNAGAKHEVRLHENEFMGAGELYNYTPQFLENNAEGGVDYRIALENGEAESEMPVTMIQNGFQINTGSLLEGHYKVFGNEDELSSFIHMGEKPKGSPLGFVELFFQPALKKNVMEELEGDELSTYHYHINFKAREVFWKYLIIPNYLKRVKKLSVSSKKGEVGFKAAGEEMKDETKTFSFISEKPIPFRKSYNYEIQLKKQEGEGGKKTLLKKMAFAPFDMLKPYDEEHYLSEIQVYI